MTGICCVTERNAKGCEPQDMDSADCHLQRLGTKSQNTLPRISSSALRRAVYLYVCDGSQGRMNKSIVQVASETGSMTAQMLGLVLLVVVYVKVCVPTLRERRWYIKQRHPIMEMTFM